MSPVEQVMLLERATRLRAPALVPEVVLHLMPEDCSFAAFRAQVEPYSGLAPPYWAVAWPGGQALARYVLDNRKVVAERRVIDIGAGCGLAGIAAAMAGASRVTAVDPDAAARAICRLNAARNGVSIDARDGDIGAIDPAEIDVVLAGDLWYEPHLARRATSALRALAGRGILAMAGDPGRAAMPRTNIDLLASYGIAASPELERTARIDAMVWRIAPAQ